MNEYSLHFMIGYILGIISCYIFYSITKPEKIKSTVFLDVGTPPKNTQLQNEISKDESCTAPKEINVEGKVYEISNSGEVSPVVTQTPVREETTSITSTDPTKEEPISPKPITSSLNPLAPEFIPINNDDIFQQALLETEKRRENEIVIVRDNIRDIYKEVVKIPSIEHDPYASHGGTRYVNLEQHNDVRAKYAIFKEKIQEHNARLLRLTTFLENNPIDTARAYFLKVDRKIQLKPLRNMSQDEHGRIPKYSPHIIFYEAVGNTLVKMYGFGVQPNVPAEKHIETQKKDMHYLDGMASSTF